MTVAALLLLGLINEQDGAASQRSRTPEQSLVLAHYSDELQSTAGLGRGCVILECADVRFVVGTIEFQPAFNAYRTSVREAIDPVKSECDQIKPSDRGPNSAALDAVRVKHIARVRAAVDAAQAELMIALGADERARQRMIRHALWRSARDGSDSVGFDIGMLYEDDCEATSLKLRAALDAHPGTSAQVRALLAAHDLRVGPAREASITIHRSAFSPNKARTTAQSDALAKSLVGVRASNETLLDGISTLALNCGASETAFEWRARAFKLRGDRLLPRLDLLDTFDASRSEDDAIDESALRDARLRALEQRDLAVRELLSSYTRGSDTLGRQGPNAASAESVIARFTEAATKWEECERRMGADLKAQLRDPASRAGLAIDRYIKNQDSLAWDHWRDLVQFWTSFVEDQRRVK